MVYFLVVINIRSIFSNPALYREILSHLKIMPAVVYPRYQPVFVCLASRPPGPINSGLCGNNLDASPICQTNWFDILTNFLVLMIITVHEN
jgi:hypothetical protein